MKVNNKACYVHTNENFIVDSEEEAKFWVKFFNSVIDSIAVNHPVFVRRLPGYTINHEFEPNQVSYRVYVRFSIGDKEKSGGHIGKQISTQSDEFVPFGI